VDFLLPLLCVIALFGIGILVWDRVRHKRRMEGTQQELRKLKADSSLQHKVQHELEISESKYQHAFDHCSDGILIVQASNLQILEVNQATQSMTGYSSDELLKLPLAALCPALKGKEQDIAQDPSSIRKVFSSYGNLSVTRKDGNMVLAQGNTVIVDAPAGPTIHIFLQEMTERRQLEQQLRQAEKLSALGQLISGVAHELNNPLAVISGYAQLLTMRPVVDEKTRNDLMKIQRESERASRIVQNFLTFARKHPMEKTNVNLNELIEFTLELIDYDLRASGVRLVREFQTDLPEVYADLNQLEQVFLNIINNAIHAMEGVSREKVLTIRTESNGTHVMIRVIDSGSGIAPSILEKIFDPFFTTKEVGVGTGLGLSISYSIVKEHSGNIYAENHTEGGAMFTVELPISTRKRLVKMSDSEVREAREQTMVPHRVFDVLVVDDEPSIQDVFVELLSSCSCTVQCTSNGLQAMKLIQQQNFDLVICDLKMPGMDGRRLFEAIKEVKPELARNFIFITGDTNSPKAFDFLQSSGNPWMAKPFNFKALEGMFIEHFRKIQVRESKGGG
jgi:two-component system, NtrC family, sensor kinase